MAISINLLAEAQAAEEQRRKDPVKRAAVAAGFIVFLVILWATTLQLKIMASKSELASLDAKWKRIESSYQAAVEAQRTAIEAEQKLTMLHQMSTNRFLWGTVFNALQQSHNGVSDVQAVRLRTEQLYAISEEIKPRTNGVKLIPGKPSTATEKVSMTIDAIDTSPQPGANVNGFKEAIASTPFFKENLGKTNGVLLTSRSAPQTSPDGNRQLVTFSLQCNFPEKTR
jgi:hypothetical protein